MKHYIAILVTCAALGGCSKIKTEEFFSFRTTIHYTKDKYELCYAFIWSGTGADTISITNIPCKEGIKLDDSFR